MNLDFAEILKELAKIFILVACFCIVITGIQVENGRLIFDSIRDDNGGLYECSAMLEEQSTPLSIRKLLHVEKTKRKRKHISDKRLHKKLKLGRKHRRLFGEWESTL